MQREERPVHVSVLLPLGTPLALGAAPIVLAALRLLSLDGDSGTVPVYPGANDGKCSRQQLHAVSIPRSRATHSQP